jgi:O-antigen/teichoic acid export membrane protein
VTDPLEGRADAGPTAGGRARSLTANAAFLALGSMLAQGALIVNLSVLARIVAKTQIATYQQLNLLYGIVSPLFLGGVPAALLYFIPRATDARERSVWILRAYVILATMGVIAAAAAVAFRDPLSSAFNNPQLAKALPVYSPFLFCAFISAAGPPALVASGRAGAAAVLNGALGVSIFAASVVAALISPTGTSLAMGLTVAGASLAGCSVVVVWRSAGLHIRDPHRLRGLRELLAYGLPLALTGVAGTLGFQLDRVVVGSRFPPETFAIYALGAVEIPIGLLIGQAVTNVLVPTLTLRWREGDRVGMVAVWRSAMRKTSTVLLPMFTFFMVMAEDVIRTLYGPGYAASTPVFRIYLTLIPMRVATWGLIPQAIRRTRINLSASIVILLSNAAIAVSLVGPLGIEGAALAAPISTVIAAGYYLVRLRAITGFAVRDLLPLRALGTTLLVATTSTIPLLLVRQLSLPPVEQLLLAGIVFVLFVVPSLRLTRQISDSDWARATRLLARLRRGGA